MHNVKINVVESPRYLGENIFQEVELNWQNQSNIGDIV